MYYREYAKSAASISLAMALSFPVLAQDAKESKDDSGAKAGSHRPSEAEMMAMMMDLAKPGDNHKRMQEMAGEWSYAVKWWMSPDAPPAESSGTAVVRSVMGGRYVISDHAGKMQMPGPDGKMADMEFNGMSVEGFDNVKKKFVSSWIDNMGTGIMNSEGTYDADTRTLTYTGEYEPMPGMKTKIKQLIKVVDKDHHTMEYFELRGGKEVKTMEISYRRKT
jgi:hypothetical protein